MGATVQMNPKYVPEQDNAYVFNSVPGTGFATTALRYYTVNYKAKSTGEKWEHVGDFIPIVENLVKKWTAMMKGSDRKALMALMLVTMYLTQMRASAKEGNAKGATTYGLTTLLVKHVKNLKGKVRLFYPGKDNVTQTHDIPQNTVLNKMVGQRILALAKNRKPTDRLWSMDDKPCNYAELYTFFKSQVPPGITMHKIRHVTGTRMAKEIFDNSPLLKKKEVTQTEAEAWVKTALTQVGAKLGHIQGQKVTPMTAIKNYISPPLIVEFFEKLKLRSPTWVPVAEK
jgi:DNA topoisomerase IB